MFVCSPASPATARNLFGVHQVPTCAYIHSRGFPLGMGCEIGVCSVHMHMQTNKNTGASVHQRTIPTELPPLVGEVSANFSG
jgi:hypothetical protein